jgi:hypothetical protein
VIVGRPQDLGVFDTPAHIVAVRPVSGRHSVQGLLVPPGDRGIAAIADGAREGGLAL